MKIINYNNKAISPVVATALLLVVAVVAVVGFQGWFNTYSSGMFADVETKSGSSLNTQIDSLIGDKLYFKNGKSENISVNSVKINGIDCNVVTNLTSGMNEINLTVCTNNLPEISEAVVYTSKGIFSKKFYVKNFNTNLESGSAPALNCSNLGLLGGEWISIPGNPTLGTVDFCVMKFEAKFANYTGKTDSNGYNTYSWLSATGDLNVTSTSSGGPISDINQSNAEIACQNLGPNYHLISDPQWVTIARNAEIVSQNWDSGIVYTGSIVMGHTDGSPYRGLNVTNVNDPFDQTLDSIPSKKRTIILSNNETMWDFGGNMWEWTSLTLQTTGIPNSSLGIASSGFAIVEFTILPNEYKYLGPINESLNSSFGIGQVYYNADAAFGGGSTHAILRGGFWGDGLTVPGIFYFNDLSRPNFFDYGIGFRCVYNP